MRIGITAVVVLAGGLLVGTSSVSAASMTLMGKVSDSMCGMHHKMANEAACTNGCVKAGADYALVVKDKVYILKANTAQKAMLAKLAAKQAKVVGDVNGTTVTVSEVHGM
jgi:hypothetical protein